MNKEKAVVKKIELELYFRSDFVPPDKFGEPTRRNNWHSKCSLCQFYGMDDDTGLGWCGLNYGPIDAEEECPIKKFFK